MVKSAGTVVILMCALLNVVSSICKTNLTPEEQAVLDAHNKLRALHVDTDPLCYGETGEDVTFSSQSWTEKIAGEKQMTHSAAEGYGENIATAGTTGQVKEKSPAYVESTQMWYDEIKFWDYKTNAKSASAPENEAVGHFTQVVWRTSKQVNCGYATYTKVSGEYEFNNYMVTCQYYPAGNYNNQYAENVGSLKSAETDNGTGSEGATCKKHEIEDAQLTPNTDTVKEGETYTVTCAHYEEEEVRREVTVMTCGSDGNLRPEHVSCDHDHHDHNGSGFLALSTALMVIVVTLLC